MCIKHYYSGNYRTCCLKEKQQKTAVFLLYSTSNRFLVNGRKTVLFKTIPIVYKHPFSLFVYFARKVPYFQTVCLLWKEFLPGHTRAGIL